MVLINNLTIDEINAALLHLQRSRTEVVGGQKESGTQNVSITNNVTGSTTDWSNIIDQITKRLTSTENQLELQKTTNEMFKDKDTALQNQINEILNMLDSLSSAGITDMYFDESTRELVVNTEGDSYSVYIPSEEVDLSINGSDLTLTMGEQTTTVTLDFIPNSARGVAGGVATLDSSGRIPFSQLPESAMEFLGQWDASTNTPHLEDGVGTNGDFYIVSTGGTVNFGTSASPRNITFYPNDRVVYDGGYSEWFRLPAGAVSSVNGMSGAVVLNGTNVNYDNTVGSPTLKAKIDDVETKADTQVDWNESSSTSLAYIKNKPTIPAPQVQADWVQTDSTSMDFIKHKIPIWITSGSAIDDKDVVDIVQDGNMHPVTSNAVYDKNFIKDVGNGVTTTFAYSKAGLSGNPSWMAAWNGYELRAIAPEQIRAGGLGGINIANIRIGSAQARISLNQLMTWLITTKGYIPSGIECYKVLGVPWDYAGNDILQLQITGDNYELQLAGCIIEFFGNATNYNTGRFRLRIHSSPTTSFTATSGYTKFPTSSCVEYTCNGSGYSPVWTLAKAQDLVGTHVNEFNFIIPGNSPRVWFNYRNGLTDDYETSSLITDYYFGNRNKTTAGVTLNAANFSGTAANATNAEKLGGYGLSTTVNLAGIARIASAVKTSSAGQLHFGNGILLQWGRISKGSNLSAGGTWDSTVNFLNLGLSNYTAATNYIAIATNETSNAGTEISIMSKAYNEFKIHLYNRNSGTTMSSPIMQWFTIGY